MSTAIEMYQETIYVLERITKPSKIVETMRSDSEMLWAVAHAGLGTYIFSYYFTIPEIVK